MEEKKEYTKKDLVEKAKELAESDDLAYVYGQLRDLQRQWKRTGSEEESMFDKEMSDQYYAYLDKIHAREKEAQEQIVAAKKAIIAKGQDVLKLDNFKKATDEMDKLLEEWKKSGRTTREQDDALWAEFKTVRDQFYANRKAHYEAMRQQFADNTAAKQALIEKAVAANQLDSIKEMNATMKDLMEQWKKVGNAGREHEQQLWETFNAERQKSFDRSKEYYANLRKTFAERTAKKQDILAQAKKNLARGDYSDAAVEDMKNLRRQWKEVGNAGRENEEKLWQEFDETMNIYFDHLRENRRSQY